MPEVFIFKQWAPYTANPIKVVLWMLKTPIIKWEEHNGCVIIMNCLCMHFKFWLWKDNLNCISCMHVDLEREVASPKSEGKMAEIEELLDASSSPFLLFNCIYAVNTKLARSLCRNLVFWHRFKNSKTIWFYELINEPILSIWTNISDSARWKKFIWN
jgi:hypothetical protein